MGSPVIDLILKCIIGGMPIVIDSIFEQPLGESLLGASDMIPEEFQLLLF